MCITCLATKLTRSNILFQSCDQVCLNKVTLSHSNKVLKENGYGRPPSFKIWAQSSIPCIYSHWSQYEDRSHIRKTGLGAVIYYIIVSQRSFSLCFLHISSVSPRVCKGSYCIGQSYVKSKGMRPVCRSYHRQNHPSCRKTKPPPAASNVFYSRPVHHNTS